MTNDIYIIILLTKNIDRNKNDLHCLNLGLKIKIYA